MVNAVLRTKPRQPDPLAKLARDSTGPTPRPSVACSFDRARADLMEACLGSLIKVSRELCRCLDCRRRDEGTCTFFRGR